MDGNTVKFENLQKTNREHCKRLAQNQFSIVYQQLKKSGLNPDYIFLGAWDCLFDEIVPEMSELGNGYVVELMGFDIA